MLELLSELKVNLTKHIGWCLAAVCLFGYILGAAFSGPSPLRSQLPSFKEGFLLLVPLSRLTNPQRTLKLRGQRIQLLSRISDKESPCKAKHAPLIFAANESTAALSGSLQDMESFVMSIQLEDLKSLDFLPVGDYSVPPCSQTIKITYGEGDAS